MFSAVGEGSGVTGSIPGVVTVGAGVMMGVMVTAEAEVAAAVGREASEAAGTDWNKLPSLMELSVVGVASFVDKMLDSNDGASGVTVAPVAADIGAMFAVGVKLGAGAAVDDTGIEKILGFAEAKAVGGLPAKLNVCTAEPELAVPPIVTAVGTVTAVFSLSASLPSLGESGGTSVTVTEVFSGSLLPKLKVLNAEVFLSLDTPAESAVVC